MVRRAFIFAAALWCATPALAQEGPRASAELNQMCQADGGALWGVSLCGPLLVVDPITRTVWANTQDREGVLTAQGDGWSGVLPSGVGVANTALDWAGVRWAMVLSPLPDGETERRVLIAHEAWHRVQADLGFPAQDAPNAHLATERGRTLLRLEMRALATALRSRGVGQRRAIHDALTLRTARQAAYAQARAEEAALDRNEGLAAYTAARLGAGAQANAFALRRLDDYDRHQSLSRAFPEATGPAYGLLLDQLRPRWRQELGANTPADLLAMVSRPPAASPRAVADAAERYGGAQVTAEERTRAEAESMRLAGLRAAYAGPRLELALTSPRFEFNPSRITPIEGLGSHYELLTLRDVWGELRAEEGALLAPDFRTARAVRPGPDGLSGPGWRLTLAPGWALAPPTDEPVWRLVPGTTQTLPAPQ